MIWNVDSSPVTTQDVGFLGGTRTFPQAINNAGQVVGNADTTGSTNSQHAFLYTAAGGLKDINTLVGTNPIATNIILGSSYGLYGSPLNEWGQIAATGTVNGHFHALRLDPLSPISSLSQDLRTESSGLLSDEVSYCVIKEVAFERVPAFDLAAPAAHFQLSKRAQDTEEVVADGSLPAHEELLGSADLLDGAMVAFDAPVLAMHVLKTSQGDLHALFFRGSNAA